MTDSKKDTKVSATPPTATVAASPLKQVTKPATTVASQPPPVASAKPVTELDPRKISEQELEGDSEYWKKWRLEHVVVDDDDVDL